MSRTVGSKNKDQENTKSALKSIVRELKDRNSQMESDHEVNASLLSNAQKSRDYYQSQLENSNDLIAELKDEISRRKNEIYLAENIIESQDEIVNVLNRYLKILAIGCVSFLIISSVIWFIR